MKTKQFKVSDLKEKNLNVGDLVQLIDGSSLSAKDYGEAVYIVRAYPQLTGLQTELKNQEAIVVETGLNLYIEGLVGSLYKQDIAIQIGNAIFYTSSALVDVVQTVQEQLQAWKEVALDSLKLAKEYQELYKGVSVNRDEFQKLAERVIKIQKP